MTTPSPAETRTPEQHAAVRRRSGVLSVCGAICGAAAVVILLAVPVDAEHPPAIFAVNFSFCALMMGIGLLFYARGTPGIRTTVTASLLAIGLGISGTGLFVRQSLVFHLKTEQREMGNIQAIGEGALHFAQRHGGDYPPDLLALLISKDITLKNLHSPVDLMQSTRLEQVQAELRMLEFYGQIEGQTPADFTPLIDFLTSNLTSELATLSDYQYLGNGLRLPDPSGKSAKVLPEEILIAASDKTVMGKQMISVCYADGKAAFLEEEVAESAFRASNDARVNLGFAAIRPPRVIQHAQDEKKQQGPAPDS